MAVRIGDIGEAISSLHPQGVVHIAGRRFQARAEHSALEPGRAVVVVGGDNGGLVVRGIDPGFSPSDMPHFGDPVGSSFLERFTEKADRDESEQARIEAHRRSRGIKFSAIAGAIGATVAMFALWGRMTEEAGPTWQSVVFSTFGGAALGAGVFFNLRGVMDRFDRGSGHITELCTLLALVGGTLGAILGIPAFGLAGGISLAIVAMFACGLALPMVFVLGQDLGSG